jgi:mRNA-degrading endonuclease RelE of RelBE toxin-antitoxin system
VFNLNFRPKALKVLSRVSRNHQLKINSALDNLRLGKLILLDMRRIEGTEHGHRIRIGRWRILFKFVREKEQIEIVDIFLKKDREDYQKRKYLLR